MERVGQGVGKGGQEDAGLGVGTGQKDSAVQGDDGFAGARRTGDACGTVILLLDPLALLGVEKDGSLFPREVESALQLLDVGHHAETALRVGVIKRIRVRGDGLRQLGTVDWSLAASG